MCSLPSSNYVGVMEHEWRDEEKNSARELFHNDVMAKYQKAKKTAFIFCATFLLSTSL